jgi:hypothetical protein
VRAAGAVAELVASGHGWGGDRIVELTDVALAARRLGHPVDEGSLLGQVAVALEALDGGSSTRLEAVLRRMPQADRRELLVALDAVVPRHHAGVLLDVVDALGVTPSHPRLARLLAEVGPETALRLLDLLPARHPDGVVMDQLWSMRLAMLDAAVDPPAALAERMAGGGLGRTAALRHAAGQVREAARTSPARASVMLAGLLGRAGLAEVADAATAVFDRLAPGDPPGVPLGTTGLDVRALALLCRAQHSEGAGTAALAASAGRLVDEVGAMAGDPDADLGVVWGATTHLLGAATTIGSTDLLDHEAVALEPEPWLVLAATWRPARRRRAAGRPVPIDTLDRLLDGDIDPLGLAARDRRNLLAVKSDPTLDLPWWNPWEAGTP